VKQVADVLRNLRAGDLFVDPLLQLVELVQHEKDAPRPGGLDYRLQKQLKRLEEPVSRECPAEGSDELDLATRRRIIDFCPAVVTINFAMCDLTWENGPIRQIIGSHTWQMRPPPPADEPDWMRLSTLVGAPAGAGVIRDNRAWHSATPNVSREIRSLPNVEYGAPWLGSEHKKTMPHEIWETLTPHGKHLCRHIKADPGVWPPGAGVMHPLGSERRAAAKRMGGTGERRHGSPGG